MSSFWSRILVALVGLPVVLGLVWLGGWWLWALAAVAGLIGLHEFYVVARPLRPLVLAGYSGLLLTLAGDAARRNDLDARRLPDDLRVRLPRSRGSRRRGSR